MGAPDTAPTTALTASPDTRVPGLDVLRGIAVAGIVPMNVIAFSMPAAAYINPRAYGGDTGLDALVWAISFVLVEDKFRALFAMMFGAGLAILLGKESDRPLAAHYARMAALLGIALAHAILLANNDVLRSYAVAGLVMPFVVRWPVRRLLVAGGLLVAGQLAVSLYYALPWLQVWWDSAPNPQALTQAERMFGAHPQVIYDALEQGRESFGERLERRLSDFYPQVRAVAASLPSTLAAMLVGVALWRSGLLAGQWERARALRLFLRLLAITLLPLAAMAAWSWLTGFDAIVTAFNALVLSAPFDLLLGVAYAALVMAMAAKSGAANGIASGWAAVGRMALTNYLGTSVVFGVLFAMWGLGLFGHVGRAEALLLGCIPIAMMRVYSPLWLARFRQGPAEWLWRSLAAGRALPLRRQPAR